jgi:2-polyprenyl-6-hydroxyphenyl methylase / 3-demethylubiquinone-9 3-methyltransferase
MPVLSINNNTVNRGALVIIMLSEKELINMYGKEYVEAFERGQLASRLERLFKHICLCPEDEIVDFGCGNGMMLPLLASKVKSYTGVDFSQAFIDAAERTKIELSISNAKFVCADIEHFCEENKERYDIAFAIDLSEHIYDERWLKILQAIKGSIKSGGRFYIHTPNSEYFLEKMKKHNFILRQFPEHVAVRSPRENSDLLEQAGFRINKVRLMPHYNKLKLIHVLSFIPFIGRYFKARIFIESIAVHNASAQDIAAGSEGGHP